MDIDEQIAEIDSLLKNDYGLDIGDWIPLRELLDSHLTYSENLELVKDYLKRLIEDDRNRPHIVDRIGEKAFWRLQEELLRPEAIEIREIQIEKGETVLIKTPVMDLVLEVWQDGDYFDLRLPDPNMGFEYVSLSRGEIISKGVGKIKAKGVGCICLGNK